jgi:MoaA/NifB/PqqE/SkfB family radical SAM enzyme
MRPARLASHYLRFRFRSLHPFEVQAVLLNACNLKCAYCRCPEIRTELMDTAQWCDIVRRLAAAGTLRIKFQGGEPTLRRDFREITAEARRAGLITAVVTNGTRIAGDPSLLDHLDEVVVSMDALTGDRHDRVRGTGSHAACLQTLRRSRARGLKTYVNMVVHRDTLPELEPMLEFCEAEGFGLNAQAVMFGHEYQDKRASGLQLSDDEERRMYRQLAEWKRRRRPLMFSAATYARTAAWPDFSVLTTPAPGRSSCMAGRFYIDIEPNGDVLPCGLHGGPFTRKNIVRDGFAEAVRNARHHRCGDCSLAYLNERKAVFGLRPSALLEVVRRT